MAFGCLIECVYFLPKSLRERAKTVHTVSCLKHEIRGSTLERRFRHDTTL